MPEISQDTVNATFLSVVEKLTYMFGEPEDKHDLDTEMVEFTMASMTFIGDLPGEIFVAVPTSITGEIAANILGLEPEDLTDKSVLEDALGEMLNVVCGHVIMALIGTEANFKLGSPHIRVLKDEQLMEILADPDFVGFDLDDSPVFLGLKTES